MCLSDYSIVCNSFYIIYETPNLSIKNSNASISSSMFKESWETSRSCKETRDLARRIAYPLIDAAVSFFLKRAQFLSPFILLIPVDIYIAPFLWMKITFLREVFAPTLSQRVERRTKQRNIKLDARQGTMLDRKAPAVSSIVPERAMIQWWKGVGSCYAVGTTCEKEPEAPAHRPREEEEEENAKGPVYPRRWRSVDITRETVNILTLNWPIHHIRCATLARLFLPSWRPTRGRDEVIKGGYKYCISLRSLAFSTNLSPTPIFLSSRLNVINVFHVHAISLIYDSMEAWQRFFNCFEQYLSYFLYFESFVLYLSTYCLDNLCDFKYDDLKYATRQRYPKFLEISKKYHVLIYSKFRFMKVGIRE